MLFYGAALVACPAVADETTILFNVTIAYILYFYVCLMYNKAKLWFCNLYLLPLRGNSSATLLSYISCIILYTCHRTILYTIVCISKYVNLIVINVLWMATF